jgi:hypothetical protein
MSTRRARRPTLLNAMGMEEMTVPKPKGTGKPAKVPLGKETMLSHGIKLTEKDVVDLYRLAWEIDGAVGSLKPRAGTKRHAAWKQLQNLMFVGVLNEFMQELGMRLCELREEKWDGKGAIRMLDELLEQAERKPKRGKSKK